MKNSAKRILLSTSLLSILGATSAWAGGGTIGPNEYVGAPKTATDYKNPVSTGGRSYRITICNDGEWYMGWHPAEWRGSGDGKITAEPTLKPGEKLEDMKNNQHGYAKKDGTGVQIMGNGKGGDEREITLRKWDENGTQLSAITLKIRTIDCSHPPPQKGLLASLSPLEPESAPDVVFPPPGSVLPFNQTSFTLGSLPVAAPQQNLGAPTFGRYYTAQPQIQIRLQTQMLGNFLMAARPNVVNAATPSVNAVATVPVSSVVAAHPVISPAVPDPLAIQEYQVNRNVARIAANVPAPAVAPVVSIPVSSVVASNPAILSAVPEPPCPPTAIQTASQKPVTTVSTPISTPVSNTNRQVQSSAGGAPVPKSRDLAGRSVNLAVSR